ncbi:hypothetical protein ABL78_6090 [Leptomonas seymouri]|uniref:Uncharacterized protein n=1 Tax=Leptomonas seymouri TaxID=5684 RepID=A0A0N1PD21_LEPSE|nr:hypothetical protein ABL78_6090 [Leptomonas seymouri]|eukprot:KPI84862.1 hypothetical protein ABL78_6090 [Leptomonas seymouri]
MSQFRSLFLPLSEEEHAVFASVFPLLLSAPSTIEGEAAAAAGEHNSRPTHPSASATLTYSPTESPGNHVEGRSASYLRESAGDVHARGEGPLRSPIFAIGSARADALLVVLRSAHVVVFGLDRPRTPPYVLYRIKPLPTTHQLQFARESAGQQPRDGSGGSAVGDAEATCASLMPLSISYCCRIAVPSDGRGRGGTGGRRSAKGAVGEEQIYIRGLVGSSDGRVALFSDVAYTFSFAAHETPIAQVDAVLLPPCSLNTSSVNNGNPNNANSLGGRGGPGSHTAHRQASTAATGSATPLQQQQQRRESFRHAMERLGIVTSGADGVILLWRCIDVSMSPIVLLRPSSFARRVSYTMHYPSAYSTLLSATAPRDSREATVDAELCCPPSGFVHSTSQHAHGLRVRQFASLDAMPPPLHTSSGPNEQPMDVEEAAQRAAPPWLSLPMPGSWTTAVTAIATHNGITLVARETSLFSIVRFDAQSVARILKTDSAITQIVLQDTIALAVCARSGAVHVLTINPVTGHGAHHRTYYSYKNRSILHVSLHEASLLMSIVDVCGSTELVQLPSDVLLHRHIQPLRSSYVLGGAESLNLLASMAALRAKVGIEDVKGADVRPDAPGVVTSMYEANATLDQLNERLLLARLAVPEECDRYMAANHHVL